MTDLLNKLTTENTSGLMPVGRAILVKHYDPQEKLSSTIVIPKSAQDREVMVDQRAVVVAIGPYAWPDEPPRAKIGDKVLISRMAGHLVEGTFDGLKYRIINDRDIFAQITQEQGEE